MNQNNEYLTRFVQGLISVLGEEYFIDKLSFKCSFIEAKFKAYPRKERVSIEEDISELVDQFSGSIAESKVKFNYTHTAGHTLEIQFNE